LVAVPGAGAVFVATVDVELAGKTAGVEVFAFVTTKLFTGIAACPLLMASAFFASDGDPV
jgi:hypothetical protein